MLLPAAGCGCAHGTSHKHNDTSHTRERGGWRTHLTSARRRAPHCAIARRSTFAPLHVRTTCGAAPSSSPSLGVILLRPWKLGRRRAALGGSRGVVYVVIGLFEPRLQLSCAARPRPKRCAHWLGARQAHLDGYDLAAVLRAHQEALGSAASPAREARRMLCLGTVPQMPINRGRSRPPIRANGGSTCAPSKSLSAPSRLGGAPSDDSGGRTAQVGVSSCGNR